MRERNEAMLLDAHQRRHRYLRIAVTEQCNFRCTYCRPLGSVQTMSAAMMRTEEILRFAALCATQGVRKIRLTGGEPLLRPGIAPLVAALRALPGVDTVALTTNGMLLRRHTSALREAGLDAVNVSLDSLQPERFRAITGCDALAEVLRGIDAALEAGIGTVKINTVVMRGVNEDELEDFVAFTRAAPLEVRFIEYMPFDDNAWRSDRMMSAAEMRTALAARFALRPLPGGDAVAKRFAVEGHRGAVGIIASMTEHFCQSCERLRLTADGAVKVCLFSPGELNVRDLMRAGADDAALLEALRIALLGKWAAHPGPDALRQLHNRSMIRIGG